MPGSAQELLDRISLAQSGCATSLGDLLEMYRGYLTIVAGMQIQSRFLPKFSSSDIVQNTFLQAKRSFDQFQGSTEAEFLVWLRKIMVSQLIRQIRRFSTMKRDINLEQHVQSRIEQSSIILSELAASRDPSPSEKMMQREQSVMLGHALNTIPEHYRLVLLLKHFDCLSFEAIADRTGRTVDSVKGIWRRSVAELRARMREGNI